MQQSTCKLETVSIYSGEKQKGNLYIFRRNTDLIQGGAK
jgi:hypothetical protein